MTAPESNEAVVEDGYNEWEPFCDEIISDNRCMNPKVGTSI